MPQPQTMSVIRFGVFEMEPQSGILRKHGVRVRLQDQPFRVLLALLEKRGEVLTREELQQKVWPGTPFGDFDHSLNIAINKIREALGDSAENPRFVETLPRRGYRFIAQAEGLATPVPAVAETTAPATRRMAAWLLAAVLALGAAVLVAGAGVLFRTPAPPRLEWRRVTNDSLPKFEFGRVLSDGARLYFQSDPYKGLNIFQVPLSGGEPARLPLVPPPGTFYRLSGISANGQELLVVSHADLEAGPLWAIRIADGSIRRIGSLLVRAADYSPDGKRILFTSGGTPQAGSLWVASSDGSNAQRLLELKEIDIVHGCWSPGGERIVFGQLNRATGGGTAWEVMADGSGLRRLFPDWTESHVPAGWAPDGRLLLTSQGQLWTVQARHFFDRGPARRIQLSSGEPICWDLTRLQRSQTFYTVGTTPLGQLQRFDTRSRTWAPHLGGISAETVEYSRDGQSVVYATYPEGELWVRRADGSQPLQLTKAPMQGNIGRWSPDDRVIAFAGKSAPDQPWRIYLVDATGGGLRPACPRGCVGSDLAWMPDGKKIVFAAPALFWTEEHYLRLLDLGTGEVTKFPGSEGLYSPRVSPDGSTLAALIWLDRGLALYRFSGDKWEKPPQPDPGIKWPSWSRDGRSIWYWNGWRGAIMRFHVRENRHEEMLPLKGEEMTGLYGYWFNLTPNDEPMTLRRRDVQQIYALDWKER